MTYWCENRSIVAASNRSVLNSTEPVKPSGVSSNPSERSNFDVPGPLVED